MEFGKPTTKYKKIGVLGRGQSSIVYKALKLANEKDEFSSSSSTSHDLENIHMDDGGGNESIVAMKKMKFTTTTTTTTTYKDPHHHHNNNNNNQSSFNNRHVSISSINNVAALNEIKILQRLRHHHVNIIRLLDIRVKPAPSSVSLILEYMHFDLEKVIYEKEISVTLTLPHIKAYVLQILSGLNFLHENGILHRDLKPNNLLINTDGILKICDFGISMIIVRDDRFLGTSNSTSVTTSSSSSSSSSSTTTSLSKDDDHDDDPSSSSSSSSSSSYTTTTNFLTTRYYRPPELLYGSRNYQPSIDMWSLGCVICELLLRRVFLDGISDLNQLWKIFHTFGTPTRTYWPEMFDLPDYIEFRTEEVGLDFEGIFSPSNCKNVNNIGCDLMYLLKGLMQLNPEKRLTCKEALKMEYFTNSPYPTVYNQLPKPISCCSSSGSSSGSGNNNFNSNNNNNNFCDKPRNVNKKLSNKGLRSLRDDALFVDSIGLCKQLTFC